MAKLDHAMLSNCNRLHDFLDRTSVKRMAYEYHPNEIQLIQRAVQTCVRKTGVRKGLEIDFNFIIHASRDVRDMHRAD